MTPIFAPPLLVSPLCIVACPRPHCGGSVAPDAYGDPVCLLCGRSPGFVHPEPPVIVGRNNDNKRNPELDSRLYTLELHRARQRKYLALKKFRERNTDRIQTPAHKEAIRAAKAAKRELIHA